MAMKLVQKIVEQAKEMRVPNIWLGLMTEALIHPEIKEILSEFAKVQAMDYWLITNGTKLTNDIAESILESQISVLSVSLDAATDETYKKIRGADLGSVTKNIMNVVNKREKRNLRLPRLRVSFVDMPDNRNEKELFISQWGKVADIIDFQQHMKTELIGTRKHEINQEVEFHCPDPFSRVLVRYNGELWPCCGMDYKADQPMNLNETTLLQYWNSSELAGLRNSILTKKVADSCKTCVLCRM